MKVVVAIDSLKGSLTSVEAGTAISDGIKKIYPEAEVKILPLADGGEGTVEALTCGMGGSLQQVFVSGPNRTPVVCEYGILADRNTAIIEMAGAAGITLIPEEERNPLYTTTYGVGEVITDAIQKGCRNFIIGIGGSATNDGGAGMLQALGYELLNKEGKPIRSGASGLEEISEIRTDHVLPELKDCTFHVACDVSNVLCGPSGCSKVFGPQKGASPEMVENMDCWMSHYADIVCRTVPEADPMQAGSGAAGGMGFAFRSFTNAVLESGIDIVLKEIHLEDQIRDADFVITGEGRLDSQTVMGKAPIGVAKYAKEQNKPVLAFSGSVTEDAGICNQYGIDAFFPILRKVGTLEEAMNPEQSRKNLSAAAEQVFRLVKAVRDR